ncbi:MAG TPA: peptidase M23 [Sulfurimonas sp. UBA12504]|nr:MAG: peptidase M23 [Sulfurimonas sp. GWF2_37_8]DAB29619.1 MAG TPA: peptidase M23 [Sulfurimonas sp. UBA12504]
MRLLFLLFFATYSLFALEYTLADSSIANGKTTFIIFQKEQGVVYDRVAHADRAYKIFEHPLDKTKMYALIPMSYDQMPSKEKLRLHYKKNEAAFSEDMFVVVKDGKYAKEQIQVTKSKVNPTSEAVKKRISQEYDEAMRIYGTVNKESYIKSAFIAPMQSVITSDFGKARVYNDSLKGYHGGTDYRAAVGTTIVASNDGVVALVADRFYSGGTVLVDHGQGIYTCYFHMSRFDVKKGQKIKKSQQLGLSGASGRVSGPHLHFAVRINKIQVDPLQFIELINNKILKEI